MRFIVKRIESLKKEGTSKTGNAYVLDFTNIIVDVPYDRVDGFGSKEMKYQFGSAENFKKLEVLRGKLPCEVELVLGTELDSYDNPVTVVTDIKMNNTKPVV